MVRRSWLFGLLLAVPLLGLGVARAVKAHFNSELRSAIRARHSELTETEIAALTLDRVCREADPPAPELCPRSARLAVMSAAAAWAGVIAVALLFSIWAVGRLSRHNRKLLLYFFKPGLYLTVLVLIGLIVTHAAIAIAVIYFGETALTNRIHAGLIAAVGAGAAVGALAMARSALALVGNARVTVIGRAVGRSEAPVLWARVEEAAGRLRSLEPDHILVGLEPSFFVTEADVTCLSGRLRGRTLYCSLPLCRILDTAEFRSIVGHELGHFTGEDTKFSERFYPIYRGTLASIGSLRAAGGDGARGVALLPAMAVLSYFFECFSVAEDRLSRDRELAADRAGAELADPGVAASALIKLHAFAGVWSGFDETAVIAMRDGKVFANASKLFAEAVSHQATPAALAGITESRLSHPTDSHPPLSTRLNALGQDLASRSAEALNVAPADTALEWIPAVEQIEEEITEAYQLVLARRIGIDMSRPAEAR